jgi:hypothetical protein
LPDNCDINSKSPAVKLFAGLAINVHQIWNLTFRGFRFLASLRRRQRPDHHSGVPIDEIARRLSRDEVEVRDKVAEVGRACR